MLDLKIKYPTIEELLVAGVHFGHQTKRWSPLMIGYIYGSDNKSHIIDVMQTLESLKKACEFLYSVAKQNKQIVIVGTKRQASKIVEDVAKKSGALFVNQRWLGGTFTNYSSVKSKSKELERLSLAKQKDELGKYTKKEQLLIERKIQKLELVIGGIRTMDRHPGAVVIIDVKKEHVAIAEARQNKIPVIAMVDTNVNPTVADYPIPSNDDAIKSIGLIMNTLGQAIEMGYKDYVPVQSPNGQAPEIRRKVDNKVANAPKASTPVNVASKVEKKVIVKKDKIKDEKPKNKMSSPTHSSSSVQA